MKEGTLVRVPIIPIHHRDAPLGEISETSYGIVLCQMSNRFGNKEGFKVWVFDKGKAAVYDEYWINPLT